MLSSVYKWRLFFSASHPVFAVNNTIQCTIFFLKIQFIFKKLGLTLKKEKRLKNISFIILCHSTEKLVSVHIASYCVIVIVDCFVLLSFERVLLLSTGWPR